MNTGAFSIQGHSKQTKRDQRFPVVMTKRERKALDCLAHRERISAAAVVRRLIWREAQERGIIERLQGGDND